MRTTILSLFVLCLAGRALAADETAVATPERPPAFEISLKAGGHFPQITNKLGTNFDAILKVGYGVALDRKLQVFADLAYTQPSYTSTGTDPRLGASGSDYTSTLTVHDLTTTVGADYFFRQPSSIWLPYAGAGLQVHFLRSDVTGSGGAAFGDTSETSTQIGGAVFGGTGVHLGPGLLLGELRFSFAPVSQRVTGSANVGALSILLGYGLLF